MTISEPIILATIGGLCIQLLTLLELNQIPKSRRPNFTDWTYWLPYIINPFLGGLLGYAYFNHKDIVDNMLAIHIGASAPLILRSMVSIIPKF